MPLDEARLAAALGPVYDPNVDVVYVDVVNGLNGNTGLTPALAKATYGGGTGALSVLTAGRPAVIVGFDDGSGAPPLHQEDPVVLATGAAVDLTFVHQGTWRWRNPSTAAARLTITAVATGPNAYDLDITTSAAHNFTVGQGVFISGALQQNGTVMNGCGIVTASLGAQQFRVIVHTQGSSPHVSAAGGFVWSAALTLTRPQKVRFIDHVFGGSGATAFGGLVCSWADEPAGIFGSAGGDVLVKGGAFDTSGLGFVGTSQNTAAAAGGNVRVVGTRFGYTNFLGNGNGVANLGTSSPYLLVTGDLADAQYEACLFTNFEFAGVADGIQIGTVLEPSIGELFHRCVWEDPVLGSVLDAERYANPAGSTKTLFRRNTFHNATEPPVDITGTGVAFDEEPLDFFGRDLLPHQRDLQEYVFENGQVHFDVGGTFGTEFPIGTKRQPVSGVANMLTIASANQLKKILLLGGPMSILGGDTVSGFDIEAAGGQSIFLTGNLLSSKVKDIVINVIGASAGARDTIFDGCTFIGGTLLTAPGGLMKDCLFIGSGDLVIANSVGGGEFNILRGSQVPVNNQPLSVGPTFRFDRTTVSTSYIDFFGNLTFEGITATDQTDILVSLHGGTLTLDPSIDNPNFNVTVIGSGFVTNNATTIGTVDTSGLLPGAINSGAIAAAVWEEADTTGGAGSMGERQRHLDADVSTRATQADILSDATPFAGANVDATISSRATPADVSTAETNILAAIAALNNLGQADVQSALTAQGYTTARAALLDNLDRAVSTLFGGNTRTQLFFADSAITGGREVPANAVSHMRVELGDDATPPDFSSPTVYFVVFNYASSDTASDAAKSSSIQAAAPSDGTFSSEPFPPAS